MAVNPVGYVALTDGSIPQTITVIAAANLSGGQFAYLSGTAANVSSGASSFVPTDMAALQASGTNYPCGVVKQNVASGAHATIVTNNAKIICTAAGTVICGGKVYLDSNDAVKPIAAGSITDVVANQIVGRALTAAGSEGYCVVDLNVR